MKYFVINKSKKYNFLHSFTLITEKVWSVIYSNKKNSPRPNNVDFWYFADETIIKTCTKFHFVMNLFPVSTHMWLYWPPDAQKIALPGPVSCIPLLKISQITEVYIRKHSSSWIIFKKFTYSNKKFVGL